MSKTIVNFWLDLFLMLVFTALAGVSAIVQFVFPPGTSAAGWELWGLDYVAWRDIQFGLLCLLGASVILHVMLHWTWVCGVIFSRLVKREKKPGDGIRTLYGVALLIVLLHVIGAAYVAALFSIRESSDISRRTEIGQSRMAGMDTDAKASRMRQLPDRTPE